MVDIKNIRLPPVIPDIGLPEHFVDEHPAQGWEFKQGNTTFNFQNGRILMNNQDLSKLVSENLTHFAASYWTGVTRKLENYRQWALRRAGEPDALAVFAAMVQALMMKIGGRLKKKFDEKIDGIAFQLEDGQLLLNGVNIHAFLEMAKRHPTQKSKIFLKGLKNRLGVMLTNRQGNPNYEKIRSIVEQLWDEIDAELVKPPQGVIYLPAPNE